MPGNSTNPTPRALDVLRFVRWHIRATGSAPTRRDIGEVLGVSAPTAHQHLQALEASGLVTRVNGWRGIQLTSSGARCRT